MIRDKPISGAPSFYIDANKSEKAGYKSEHTTKVLQSPYNSVQKSELYALMMVLMDLMKPLDVVSEFQ